ncbi:trypsin-like serine peptidase [Bacillus sp. NPDC077027]|uniref:trypsin-like serine peptidase n=1 Tax=Bacillus sp. NPDC077027 TaxID=3390548 RepID=UPI003CFC5C7F
MMMIVNNGKRGDDMRKFLFILSAILTALTIIVCLNMPKALATSKDKDSLTQSKTSPVKPKDFKSSSNLEDDPTGYWTKDRMKKAIPNDPTHSNNDTHPKNNKSSSLTEEKPSDISDPVAPDSSSDAKTNVVVPSTAGKVFYSYDRKDYVCSASAINNDYKNLVITAGHCVHGGKDKGWHSNIAFAPAYYNGSLPYGIWNWKEARTFNAWINNSHFSHDQAFFTVYPKTKNLINTVGGNGLSTGYGKDQPSVRIFGWPAESPFDGQLPYFCDGASTSAGLFSTDAKMPCDMNGGASGGPWLREIIDENLGYVFAVTSRRSTSGTPTLFATPNSQDVRTMFDLME